MSSPTRRDKVKVLHSIRAIVWQAYEDEVSMEDVRMLLEVEIQALQKHKTLLEVVNDRQRED